MLATLASAPSVPSNRHARSGDRAALAYRAPRPSLALALPAWRSAKEELFLWP